MDSDLILPLAVLGFSLFIMNWCRIMVRDERKARFDAATEAFEREALLREEIQKLLSAQSHAIERATRKVSKAAEKAEVYAAPVADPHESMAVMDPYMERNGSIMLPED